MNLFPIVVLVAGPSGGVDATQQPGLTPVTPSTDAANSSEQIMQHQLQLEEEGRLREAKLTNQEQKLDAQNKEMEEQRQRMQAMEAKMKVCAELSRVVGSTI